MEKQSNKIRKRLLVGITGGIGAGKSMFAKALADLKYPVFSADQIAREVVTTGQPALAEIRALFGDRALKPDGTLDRAFLRQEIMRDSKLRQKLEKITHPRIQERAETLAKEAFAAGAEIVFYEAPLLYEAKSDSKMDKVICVYASDETRIQRIMGRDQCERSEAEQILASQLPQEEKMNRSDYLVENNGSEADLQRAAADLVKNLLGS